jgi:hypothetical protein
VALSSSVRIRIFDIGANRGVGNEICVIYDAKNVGSEVYANDVGSAFWTLPVEHPLVPELIPLKRHYKVERLSGASWILIGAGILTTYDATNDEIVYEGMDYMTMLSMHYTKLVGPESGSDVAIKRDEPANETTTVGPVTITATRSASMLYNTTSDWNSNDTEDHMVVGAFPNTFDVRYYNRDGTTAEVGVEGNTFSLLSVGQAVYFQGTSSSQINGLRTITSLISESSTSGRIFFTSGSSGLITITNSTGNCYFKRYTSRGLVKFTLPAELTSSATVTQAELKFTQSNTSGDHSVTDSAPGNLKVNASGIDWTVDSSTGSEGNWGNSSQPNCDWDSSSASTSGSLSDVTYTAISNVHNSTHAFSISSIVDYWKASPANNNGLLLFNNNETGVTDSFTLYSTAANSSNRPKLTLTYSYSTSTATNINANGLSHGPLATKSFLVGRISNSYARNSGNEIAVYTKNGAGDANKIDMTYDEVNGYYTITGYTYIERSAINNDEKLYDIDQDVYIPNRFNVNRIRVSIIASPGDEVCTFNVWPDSWTEIGTPETPVMLKWSVKLRQHDSVVAEVIAPAATTPTLSTVDGVYGNFTGTAHNTTNSYEINCLTSGISYSFAAFTTAELVNVSPQTASTSPDYGGNMTHDVNGITASTNSTQTVVMGLEKKTLQDIFTKQIPYVTSEGGAYSRFGWLTHALVSGQSWGSELIRYFTSGESILAYLRSMCDKEMAANLLTPDSAPRWDVVDGNKIPWRTVFNFVGIRGSAYPGTKIYVSPSLSQEEPVFVFDYPGTVATFRYRRNGRDIRNSVRVVPATAFLTGTTTTSIGSRSQGKLAENSSSIQEYGYAPILTTQANFADGEELQKYADSQMVKSSDILNVSMASVQLEPDSVRPFEDFYLGDVVRIAIRRTNVNYTNSAKPDFIADTYVIGGVRFELPVDGSERVTLDLVKTSEFGRG